MTPDLVLAIDAGTTGVRVNAYDKGAAIAATRYREFAQHYPAPGWVEHDAEEIWRVTRELLLEVAGAVGDARRIAAIGITNQRETTVLWDRSSGRPLHRAIVWQDRRTAPICERLKNEGKEPLFRKRTGLVLDAYFSGTKVTWLAENAPEVGARLREAPGEVCFGTIDAWLAFKLSGGAAHVTDPTNASRTLLYDIDARRWDEELCAALRAPLEALPRVVGSAERYGETEAGLLPGGVRAPLAGIAGDQQSALYGQGCFTPGESKNTYGTGCFALVNCGRERPPEVPGIVTTLACDGAGDTTYALEGSVFIAGAAVQWLRDGLGVIASAGETEALARSVPDAGGCTFVPAFVGLGAPYWDMDARGAILGITRGTTRAHLVRATLEAICFETRDLIEAFEGAAGRHIPELRVDGGATRNDFLLELQAGILGRPVVRPRNTESTALGAAFLGGLAVGFWSGPAEVLERIRGGERRFEPGTTAGARDALYAGWKAAVKRVLTM
jgi:glycerol kinase